MVVDVRLQGLNATDGTTDARAVVVSFARAMVDWEIRRRHRFRLDSGRYDLTAERDARLAGESSAEELEKERTAIMDAHCTRRKRAYGGAFSSPPRFSNVKDDTISEVAVVKPGRIEVVSDGLEPDSKLKFVVFLKSGEWLIDNLLFRIGDLPWERDIL